MSVTLFEREVDQRNHRLKKAEREKQTELIENPPQQQQATTAFGGY